jgi:nicotinate-nucleotide adenylyltransferase
MMHMTDRPTSAVTVICPTAFETARVRAALGAVGCTARVQCIGVGAHAASRWAARESASGRVLPPPGAVVILAGLAGGLQAKCARGSVWCASQVLASDGRVFRPPLTSSVAAGDSAHACVASVERACGSRADKAALQARTDCDLVDLESGSFCEVATAFGWRFGVVRGVSDGAEDELPGWMMELVGVDGSIAFGGLVRALVASPLRAVTLARWGGACSRVLSKVGLVVAQVAAAATTRRTLLFGGTFDPPHRMHVRMAVDAARMLGCARIVVVPAGQAPLRATGVGAGRRERLAMVRLAFAGVAGAEVDAAEIDREGESFTVDTLASVAARDHLTRAELVLLIGADQALQFDRWRSWRRICDELAQVAVVPRPPWDARSLAQALAAKFAALGCDGDAWARAVLPMPAVPMAATEVRAHRGGGASGVQALAQMADLLDPAVARFIQDRGLYAEADSASAPTIDPHVGSDEIT